jgi:hypothetical protein
MDSRKYIGMDVHKESISIAVRNIVVYHNPSTKPAMNKKISSMPRIHPASWPVLRKNSVQPAFVAANRSEMRGCS